MVARDAKAAAVRIFRALWHKVALHVDDESASSEVIGPHEVGTPAPSEPRYSLKSGFAARKVTAGSLTRPDLEDCPAGVATVGANDGELSSSSAALEVAHSPPRRWLQEGRPPSRLPKDLYENENLRAGKRAREPLP